MYQMAIEKRLIHRVNTEKFACIQGVFDMNEFTVQQLDSLRDEIMDELDS